MNFLAWLESSFQEELDPGNVQHEEHARNLVVQLVQQLESKAVESGDFLTKNKLEEIISSIKVRSSFRDIFIIGILDIVICLWKREKKE